MDNMKYERCPFCSRKTLTVELLANKGLCGDCWEGNEPCIKCGCRDNYLYTNMQCTECYDPDEEIHITTPPPPNT